MACPFPGNDELKHGNRGSNNTLAPGISSGVALLKCSMPLLCSWHRCPRFRANTSRIPWPMSMNVNHVLKKKSEPRLQLISILAVIFTALQYFELIRLELSEPSWI